MIYIYLSLLKLFIAITTIIVTLQYNITSYHSYHINPLVLSLLLLIILSISVTLLLISLSIINL